MKLTDAVTVESIEVNLRARMKEDLFKEMVALLKRNPALEDVALHRVSYLGLPVDPDAVNRFRQGPLCHNLRGTDRVDAVPRPVTGGTGRAVPDALDEPADPID